MYHNEILNNEMDPNAVDDNAVDPSNSETIFRAIRDGYVFPSAYEEGEYTEPYGSSDRKVVGWTKPSLGVSPYYVRPAVHVMHVSGTDHSGFNTTLIQTKAGMTAFEGQNGTITDHSALLKIDCDADNFLDTASTAAFDAWKTASQIPGGLEGSPKPTQMQRDSCKNNQHVADSIFAFAVVGLVCIGIGLLCIVGVHGAFLFGRIAVYELVRQRGYKVKSKNQNNKVISVPFQLYWIFLFLSLLVLKPFTITPTIIQPGFPK